MKELLKEMHAWMDAYMKSFHTDDEEVMQGIKIKEIHTGYVTSIAVQLAKHEALNSRESLLADKLVDAPPEAAVQYREARAYRYFAIH